MLQDYANTYIIVLSDENTEANSLDWFNSKSRVYNVMQATILTCIYLRFQAKYSALCLVKEGAILAASKYDIAIQ